jgi:hypothetical protein
MIRRRDPAVAPAAGGPGDYRIRAYLGTLTSGFLAGPLAPDEVAYSDGEAPRLQTVVVALCLRPGLLPRDWSQYDSTCRPRRRRRRLLLPATQVAEEAGGVCSSMGG